MTSTTPRILVVDDDPEIRKLLARYVESQGFRVLLAANCQELREQLATHQVDLIVLDVMLPDGSGLDACRDLRAQRNNVPIILLTALKEDVDRIIGLEIGADDYLAKPFNPRELLARIRAVLRRSSESGPRTPKARVHRFAGWLLDVIRRELRRADGTLVPTTDTEFDLLAVFAENPQRVLSRDHLLDRLRGREAQAFDRSIDVAVMRLRRKIEIDSARPELIKTVRNGGYVFTPDVEDGA
jgi:DNA-binding response OmpR family regulator